MRKVSIPRLLFLVGVYSLFANFAHPITPTFIQNLNLHDYMFGVAFACMAITNFLFSPFWGKVSKSYGCVKVSFICCVGYGVSQFIFGISTTELQIALARLLAGFFIGGLSVNQILYIMENSDEGMCGRNLALSAAILSVVSPFGFLVGGFVGDIDISLSFNLQAIGLVLCGVLYLILLADSHPSETLDLKKVVKESNPFGVIIGAKGLLTKALLVFLLVAALTSFATTCYEQCFNYFIKDQFGFPSSYNGILKALVGFITLAANGTITLWLMKKTNIYYTIVYVLVICSGMMAAIVFINEIVPFILVNVVFFGFNAVYQPLLQSIMSDYAKVDEGTIVGIYNSTRSFGMIFGSLLAGFIYEAGPRLSFACAAVTFLLAAKLAYMNNKQHDASLV